MKLAPAVVAVALASPALLASSVAPPAADTSPIDIGSLSAFGNSFLWAVNNRNEAVGWSELRGLDSEHAILWRDGQLVDLGVLDGFAASRALGINDRGQIVGLSVEFGLFHTRAMLWQDGRMIELAPGEDGCSARAINNRGEIVGLCPGLTLWRKGERVPVVVSGGLTGLFPAAINDAGMVAGSASDNDRSHIAGRRQLVPDVRFEAIVLDRGTIIALPSLSIPFVVSCSAEAIDQRGDVVGYATAADGNNHAVLWPRAAARGPRDNVGPAVEEVP